MWFRHRRPLPKTRDRPPALQRAALMDQVTLSEHKALPVETSLGVISPVCHAFPMGYFPFFPTLSLDILLPGNVCPLWNIPEKWQVLLWNISELSLTQTSLLATPSPLQTPHFPPDSELLLKAAETYHRFLAWPVPYCSISQELLTFIDAELKAPGRC